MYLLLYYGFNYGFLGSSFFVFQLVVDEGYCGSVIFGCLMFALNGSLLGKKDDLVW